MANKSKKLSKLEPISPPYIIASRLLILDPALESGYALFTYDGNNVSVILYGDYAVDSNESNKGKQCIMMKEFVCKLIDTHKPDKVLIEDFFFRGRTANGSTLNVAFRAAAWMACAEKNINYETVAPQTWKKLIVGKVRPTKIDVSKWNKNADKVIVQDALWNKFKFRFANHSVSHKTQKPVKLRYDIIDAVAMGCYYYITNTIGKSIQSWTCIAPPSDDPAIEGVYKYL